MEDGTSLVAETCERVFRDCAEPQAIALEPEGGEWRRALWNALEETGLATAWVPEEAGGAGASVREGFEALHTAGRFAAAAPLADTLVAGIVLARAGLDVPAGKLSAAPVSARDSITLKSDGTLCGQAEKVPFAREAAYVAVLARDGDGYRAALVERARCGLVEGNSVAGDPLDRLDFDAVAPLAVGDRPVALDVARMFGPRRARRSSRGAPGDPRPLGRVLARAGRVRTADREVPGPSSRSLPASRARWRRAMRRPTRPHGRSSTTTRGAMRCSSSRVGQGARGRGRPCRRAHRTPGARALGYSREHVLHRFTHRLWAWRDEYGDESEWALRLGEHFARLGADGMWPPSPRSDPGWAGSR